MTEPARTTPRHRLGLALLGLLLSATLAGCAGPTPPPAVAAFATRVLALDQPAGFGTVTNLDGRRVLTVRHVLPGALQRSDTVRVGSNTFDITRGVYRGRLAGNDVSILALGIGRPRHAIRTDWAVLAPHPPTLPAADTPRFAAPPPVGARVWIVGYPDALGGTEPNAEPVVLAATVMAPLPEASRGVEADDGSPVDLAGSFAVRASTSTEDLGGMSGGPVLWVAPDGSVRVVGVASQQASRREVFGLATRRWVFVCPVPKEIGDLLIAPIPEPVRLPGFNMIPAAPAASRGTPARPSP